MIGSLIGLMRVLFITGEYPPLQGGIADYTALLRSELRALDVTSEVLTDAACASTEPTVHPVVGTWGFPFWGVARQIISERRIDVVHIQYQTAAYDLKPAINLLPWYLQRRSPRPAIVTTFHDLSEPYVFPKAGPVRRWATHMLGRHSDALIFTTQEDREQWDTAVKATGTSKQGNPTHHIGLGSAVPVIPISAEERGALRSECGVAPDAFLIGFFGFVNATKGLDTLFAAVRLLRDQDMLVQVLIVGGSVGDSDPSNAVYKERLERLIRRLDLDMGDILLSTGYVEAAEASRALATCDVVALPFTDGASLRRTSLLTALDHGLPVVTTVPKQPIPELQESGALLLVPPDDPQALSDALRRLNEDRTLCETLSTAARQFTRRFSWSRIAEHTLAVYNEASRRK
ncbi:MAG: glycosyltransferase family 4 protein [Chloroflexota bacterium]|nr:glycosyltransferase family 4 protein [Chloroflexota bacterium]MDE2930326.1 glycosyltransferase family 4 protein [Chloroflexota bacterium]